MRKMWRRRLSSSYLLAALGLTPLVAQTPAASGPYGFLVNINVVDTGDENGGAVIGLMNIDDAGKVTGKFTARSRSPGDPPFSGDLAGEYKSNEDGTATLTLDLGFFQISFVAVVIEGGKAIQLLARNLVGTASGSFPLTGTAPAITGSLPMSLILDGATGNIPLSLSGATSAAAGSTVYTMTGGSGSGTLRCGDGSMGTWTASVPSLTVAVVPSLNPESNQGIFGGSYQLVITYRACGGGGRRFLTGRLTGGIAQNTVNLRLYRSTEIASGIARAAAPETPLQGAFGFLENFGPYPRATIGIMRFDGGNVTANVTDETERAENGNPGGSRTPRGTYTLNPDGSGTLTLGVSNMSFVVTDGGSGLLLLDMRLEPGPSIGSGVARLQ